jgi:hypothetical protein
MIEMVPLLLRRRGRRRVYLRLPWREGRQSIVSVYLLEADAKAYAEGPRIQ